MEDYMNFQLCIKVDNTISQISRKFGYIHLTKKNTIQKFNKNMDEKKIQNQHILNLGEKLQCV